MSLDEEDGEVVVRGARHEDLRAAAKFAAELVREHHRLDPLRFMRIEPLEEGYEEFLHTQLDRDDVAVLIAVEKREGREMVVGYALAGLEERNWIDLRDACGKLHDLYVDERARGRGVAQRLVEEAVARLEAMGAPRVVLLTAWNNERAHRFFERLGFRRTMLEMTRERGQKGGQVFK